MPRLEFSEGRSNKFYELYIVETRATASVASDYVFTLITLWGRIGKAATRKDYTFRSRYAAEIELKDIVRKKTIKGYRQVSDLAEAEKALRVAPVTPPERTVQKEKPRTATENRAQDILDELLNR
jgi:predicted DNA-binding WGR domain protein